jgi:phosphonate transport system substrate-binding protein
MRLTLILLAFLLASCGGPSGNPKSGQPLILKMGYQPSQEDVERRMQLEVFSALSEYMEQETGIPVELTRTDGYGPIIEAMRAKKIDFAQSGGSFTYLIANQKAGVEASVARGTEAGPGIYSSVIVTSPETGITSMDDVRSMQEDLVFAFVDPASTSGHLIPRAGLEEMGFDPGDFKQTVFTMNHTNSAMTLQSGKVDVGAISKSTFDRLVERGRMNPDDLVILWESPPIPQGPIIVREGLDPELKEKIRTAFLKLNEGGPLMDALREQAGVEDLTYFPANDAMWDGLRDIARNVDTMKLLGSG